MRIAVVDHVSAGGVSRFVANLIDGLVRIDGVDGITYFASEYNIGRDGLGERWAAVPEVELVPMRGAMDDTWRWERSAAAATSRSVSARLSSFPLLHRTARAIWRTVMKPVRAVPSAPWYTHRLDEDVVARLREFDLVYFAWPFFVEVPDIETPIAGTFHDFHFEHFPQTYAEDQLAIARRQTPEWLHRAEVVVTSTQFVASEIDRYFDAPERNGAIVYLASYTNAAPYAAEATDVLERYGVRHPYIIYSGGTSSHKNVLGLFEAVQMLAPDVRPQLVITGLGTDAIGMGVSAVGNPVRPVDEFIAQHGLEAGRDFVALGYVDEHDVDELTRAADLVISASRYEAGCGPALDAWKLGAPVAFSNIPPFVEQTTHFGTEALVFDQDDSADIARAIEHAMRDRKGMRAMAERSQPIMVAYTWDDVARGYYEAFQAALARREARS